MNQYQPLTPKLKCIISAFQRAKSTRKLHLSKELWRWKHGLPQLFCQDSFVTYNSILSKLPTWQGLLSKDKMQFTWYMSQRNKKSLQSYLLACARIKSKLEVKFCFAPFMCNSEFALQTSPRAKFYPKHSILVNKIE